ncbi:hypothetical protein CK203_041813 [Vitis vinifera]|uniref:Retrovirus-related Pol polyprotein from transposon TNT 1-94-like beta-barrel domain-containing protein n=1 Tax=Vitis vinifera TaxID=29760 RepID=A0A438HH92_VITVI|nr:hypothetical protein CK203_041813 [Vitis vinifera]
MHESTSRLQEQSWWQQHVPSLIPARSLWPYLNPIISLSLSFRSSVPVLRAKGENAFRSVESSSENTHRQQLFRRTFPANFRRRFFLHARSAWRRSPICPKAPEPETHPRAAQARFSGRRLHLTRRRVRAREPFSGDALPPPGSPDADQPPFLPVCAIRALHVPLLGFFCFRGPSDQIFRRPPAIFSQLQSLHVPWKCLLPFRSMTKYGMASSQVSSVTSPESGGRFEIPNLGKDEYLTGEAVMPETTEPGENFLLFGTAKDIWDAAKETYSSSENTSELFQVESALHDFRQGEQFTTYRQIVEQKRLFKFFLGLNRELDDVRAESWALNPCQVSERLFSEVRREESRKKVMMGSKEQPAPTLDASALAARRLAGSFMANQLIGNQKPRFDRDGRAHVAANSESTSVPEPSPFNKEQMEMLQKLLSQVGSGSTTDVAFTANRGGMRSWIVDTGASDHMTGDAAILQNYKPSNGHSSVHIADGSKSKIAGTGSIKLTKDLYLDSVLHDLKSGKMIGSVELCSGLYLLSCGQFSNQVSQASCVQSQSMSESFNSVSNSKGESMKNIKFGSLFLRVYLLSLRVTKSFPIPSQFAPTELSTPMPPSVQPAQHTNEEERQELEHGSQSTCGQYIDSNSSLPEENIDHPIGNYVTYEGLSPSYRAFATSLDDTQVPNTIQEALKISEWKKAVQDEIDALEKNGTWTITDLPVGKGLWGASGFSP